MNNIVRNTVLFAAVAATTFATLPAANAAEWRHWHNHGNRGDAVAAGILGLAAGALIVGALNQPQPQPSYDYYGDGYYDQGYVVRRSPRPRPAPVREYYPRQVVSSNYALEPWTAEWYRYCQDRYQSFEPRTGTFTGYDGAQHFCVAN